MSLSDGLNDDFQPFDVTTLEHYNDEQSLRTEETAADLTRFQLLFEKPVFDQSSEDAFKTLYTPPEQQEEVFFTPMIKQKPTGTSKEQTRIGKEKEPAAESDEPISQRVEPQESPEEKAYNEGYDSGYAQGQDKGFSEGHAEGLKKGYDEGFARGEAEGQKQGETKGYDQGVEQGRETGYQETTQQGLTHIQSLEQVLADLNNTLPGLLDKYEDRIVSLIEKICYKAVQASVEADDETVKPIVMDTLAALVEPEEIELTVSQEDYEYIEMVKEDFFEQVDTLQHITVRSDPLMPKGGCKVQTRTATVQADPESRLAAVFEAIKQVKLMR